MAGYKVFKATSSDMFSSQLAEIGIQYNGGGSFTFSDGKTNANSSNWGNYIVSDNWVIADDDAHFIYVAGSNQTREKSAICDSKEDVNLARLIVETTDGIIDTFNDNSSSGARQQLNMTTLDLTHSDDPTQNDLILAPLAGNTTDSEGVKYVFKSLYINYRRWFSFGDIIVSSNGDRYIGIGWILHKIGGGIIKSEYNNAPLHID